MQGSTNARKRSSNAFHELNDKFQETIRLPVHPRGQGQTPPGDPRRVSARLDNSVDAEFDEALESDRPDRALQARRSHSILSRRAAATRRSSANSTSRAVLVRPNPIRIEHRTATSGWSSARSTGDGSCLEEAAGGAGRERQLGQRGEQILGVDPRQKVQIVRQTRRGGGPFCRTSGNASRKPWYRRSRRARTRTATGTQLRLRERASLAEANAQRRGQRART